MQRILKYFFIPFAVLLFSCTWRGRNDKPKPIDVIITQKSALFNEELMNLKIDSLNNVLNVQITFSEKALKNFPFPKYNGNTSLTGSAFTFGFYKNEILLQGAGLHDKRSQHNYFGYNQWLGKTFSFTSDTLDFSYGQSIRFEIPFYAFQRLQEGEHELELKIHQDVFCSPFKFSEFLYTDSLGDSIYHNTRNFTRATLLSCAAKFRIHVPKIFKTTVYGYGIELRNDSVFSPSGMDNTIWNSSYPDVYWTIDFPEGNFYCSSDYQKSTALYDAKDTFCLYHYTPDDSISIGVWDHDNLSRDDYISYKNFSVNQFPQGRKVKFSYGNLKSIELKMEKQGYINR